MTYSENQYPSQAKHNEEEVAASVAELGDRNDAANPLRIAI